MYVTDKLILPSGWNCSGWQRWRSAPRLHCPSVPEVSDLQRSGTWFSQGGVPCRGQLRRGWAPHRPGAGPGQVSQAWKYTFTMPTYTLCREYVVSQSVLGQFFEWVTTLGIEDRVRLDLDFCPGSSLDSTPPSPPADIWLDNVSNISATGLSLPSQDPLPLSCDALAPSTSSLFTNPSVGTPAPSSAINANGHDYATPAPATLDTVVTAPPSSAAPRKALQKCPHCKERFSEKKLLVRAKNIFPCLK